MGRARAGLATLPTHLFNKFKNKVNEIQDLLRSHRYSERKVQRNFHANELEKAHAAGNASQVHFHSLQPTKTGKRTKRLWAFTSPTSRPSKEEWRVTNQLPGGEGEFCGEEVVYCDEALEALTAQSPPLPSLIIREQIADSVEDLKRTTRLVLSAKPRKTPIPGSPAAEIYKMALAPNYYSVGFKSAHAVFGGSSWQLDLREVSFVPGSDPSSSEQVVPHQFLPDLGQETETKTYGIEQKIYNKMYRRQDPSALDRVFGPQAPQSGPLDPRPICTDIEGIDFFDQEFFCQEFGDGPPEEAPLTPPPAAALSTTAHNKLLFCKPDRPKFTAKSTLEPFRELFLQVRRARVTPLDAHRGYSWQADKANGVPGTRGIKLLTGFDTLWRSFFKGLSAKVGPPDLPPYTIGSRANCSRQIGMFAIRAASRKLRRARVSFVGSSMDGTNAFGSSFHERQDSIDSRRCEAKDFSLIHHRRHNTTTTTTIQAPDGLITFRYGQGGGHGGRESGGGFLRLLPLLHFGMESKSLQQVQVGCGHFQI